MGKKSAEVTPETVEVQRADDLRMGTLFVDKQFAAALKTTDGDTRIGIGIIYFPFDEGTIRNGGREGSRNTPDKVHAMLQKFGAVNNMEYGVDLRQKVYLVDMGKAQGANLDEGHLSLVALVEEAVELNLSPMVIGGSNDQSYPNCHAWLIKAVKDNPFAVVNLDAHLDVRPFLQPGDKRHSGSPFYALLKDKRFKEKGAFAEFGAQGHQCSPAHVEFVENTHGQRVRIQVSENWSFNFQCCIRTASRARGVAVEVWTADAGLRAAVSCLHNFFGTAHADSAFFLRFFGGRFLFQFNVAAASAFEVVSSRRSYFSFGKLYFCHT